MEEKKDETNTPFWKQLFQGGVQIAVAMREEGFYRPLGGRL